MVNLKICYTHEHLCYESPTSCSRQTLGTNVTRQPNKQQTF